MDLLITLLPLSVINGTLFLFALRSMFKAHEPRGPRAFMWFMLVINLWGLWVLLRGSHG